MNALDIVLIVALIGVVALVVRRMRMNKKKGKTACGCDCGSCTCGCDRREGGR